MPRSFDMAADYPAGVEQVHRAFADPAYWRARLARSGADEATLDTFHDDGDALCVRPTQLLRAERLPGVVTQLHRGDLAIVRDERWTPVRDGRAEAVVAGSIPGAPVTLRGTAVLAPAGDGSQLSFVTSVEVKIPLVGGKIEQFIGTSLVDLLAAEAQFTQSWITAGHQR